MTTTRWTLLLVIVATVVAAGVVQRKRDPYPNEGDAFQGGTPGPGDGMSKRSNAETAS